MTYRAVDTNTWDDPWFAELQPISKLLFLYLFTNRRVTQCGSMEITVRQIAFETGISAAALPNEIEKLGDRVRWWPDHSLLIVRNFYRRQRAMTGDKFEIAARKSAASLPDFALEWLCGVYPELRSRDDTHPIPTPVGIDSHAISVQNRTETETGQDRTETPPTPSRGKRKTPVSDLPVDFGVTDDMRSWARNKHGLSDEQIDRKTERFLNWVAKTGKQYADWIAAWRDAMTWEDRPGPVALATNGRHPPSPPILQPGQVPSDGGLAAYKAARGHPT